MTSIVFRLGTFLVNALELPAISKPGFWWAIAGRAARIAIGALVLSSWNDGSDLVGPGLAAAQYAVASVKDAPQPASGTDPESRQGCRSYGGTATSCGARRSPP